MRYTIIDRSEGIEMCSCNNIENASHICEALNGTDERPPLKIGERFHVRELEDQDDDDDDDSQDNHSQDDDGPGPLDELPPGLRR